MNGTHLARADVMTELGRLLRVFRRPAHAPPDLEAFAGDYVDVCGDVSREQFSQAVGEYLKSDARFFPKPGELRALAHRQPGVGSTMPSGSFEDWCRRGFRLHTKGELTPCPACGRAWQWQPRLVLVHDHVRHRALGLPCVGSCDDPIHFGPGATNGEPKRQSAGELWTPPVVESGASRTGPDAKGET